MLYDIIVFVNLIVSHFLRNSNLKMSHYFLLSLSLNDEKVNRKVIMQMKKYEILNLYLREN